MFPLEVKVPVKAVFPQFSHQPVVVEYGKESLFLEQGDNNSYLVRDESGNVLTVLNEMNRSVSKYGHDNAVHDFIRFVSLGIQLKGAGMKGRSFSGNHDTNSLDFSQQQKIVEKVLHDHDISLNG